MFLRVGLDGFIEHSMDFSVIYEKHLRTGGSAIASINYGKHGSPRSRRSADCPHRMYLCASVFFPF